MMKTPALRGASLGLTLTLVLALSGCTLMPEQAAVAAPSQGSLTARSAQSLISNEYIRNYTSPVSDFSQVLQMAPGTFSTSANGPGLGAVIDFKLIQRKKMAVLS